MSDWRPDLNRPHVIIPRRDVDTMIRLARTLRRLALRDILPLEMPETARLDPNHEAVMMGYDFHLTAHGPRLIEVNTNAGGALMAYCAQNPCFPPGPSFPDAIYNPDDRRQIRLLRTFATEMACFSGNPAARPRLIVLLDDAPEKQFLYPEMRAFATLLTQWGSECRIASPEALEKRPDGLFHQGCRVEMIYNRHCDFYLETKPLAEIKSAWLARQVCLSPNPRQYGLLADKRRMIAWSDPATLAQLGLSPKEIALLIATIPKTFLLGSLELKRVWTERNQWVFKPFSGFGSRGVLLGTKISRTRFNELDPLATLAQHYIPPSLTDMGYEQPLKTDIRLFFYGNHPLGVAARVYRGQVTNFQMAGNGFCPVRISD
ncbi:MAG: hypothetical protein HQL94_04260 [Magnetococcales bacterium]|nr:hypothetical protein [Magnetococcales bacterium]MBF0439084.1 hypothetical protein [Magnetococcales bacterium]